MLIIFFNTLQLLPFLLSVLSCYPWDTIHPIYALQSLFKHFFQYKHKWRASLRSVTLSQRTKSLRDAVHAWNIPAYFVFQWAARMWVTVLDGQMRSLFLIHLELWVLLWKLFMWSFCCIESAFRLVAQGLLYGTAVLPLVLWVKCNQLP